MCEFCTKHGEGKKWYLNVKNYSDDLWNDIKRQKIARRHFGLIDRIANIDYRILKYVKNRNTFFGNIIFETFKKGFIKKHLGQVVSIEDVEKIFGLVNSIVRIPCICRKAAAGKDVRCCFAISVNPASLGMAQFVNNSYFDGPDISQFEKFDKNDALSFMRNMERDKIIHTVWTVMTPFVGFICNCGFDGCLSLQSYREKIGTIILKGEKIANIDKHVCTGCGKCIDTCLFNAIKFDSAIDKAMVDTSVCYGCGICRAKCENCAIALKDRY